MRAVEYKGQSMGERQVRSPGFVALSLATAERSGFAAVRVDNDIGVHLWGSTVQALDLGVPRHVQQFLVGAEVVGQIGIGLAHWRAWKVTRGNAFKNDDMLAVSVVGEILRPGQALVLIAK